MKRRGMKTKTLMIPKIFVDTKIFYPSDLFTERHGDLVPPLAGVLYHKVVQRPQPGRDLVPWENIC